MSGDGEPGPWNRPGIKCGGGEFDVWPDVGGGAVIELIGGKTPIG